MSNLSPVVEYVTLFGVLFGVPILVFLPRMKKREDIGKRMVISVFATWFGLCLQHQLVSWPMAMARAKARGNDAYDGAAAGSAVTLFGWVPAIITTALVVCGYLFIQYVRRKRQTAA